MKIIIMALIGLSLCGCQAPNQLNAPTTISVTAQLPPSPILQPTTPIIFPAHKPLLSAWTRIDGYYSVDLSALKNLDAEPEITVVDTVNTYVRFNFGSINICLATVQIVGSEDNGTLTVIRANSGSESVNNAYCNPLIGDYEYTAMSDNEYRLDKDGILSYWK